MRDRMLAGELYIADDPVLELIESDLVNDHTT